MNDIDNAPTVLSRYAKAIAKVVEAGGPRPEHGIGFVYLPSGNWMPVLQTTDSFDGHEWLITAGLEKYVREDVVVWWKHKPRMGDLVPSDLIPPEYCDIDRSYRWYVHDRLQWDEEYTEAHIAFLEAIASVVAGEKGE